MLKLPRITKKGRKWYAVRVGRQPGVYETWTEAEAQVRSYISDHEAAGDNLQHRRPRIILAPSTEHSRVILLLESISVEQSCKSSADEMSLQSWSMTHEINSSSVPPIQTETLAYSGPAVKVENGIDPVDHLIDKTDGVPAEQVAAGPPPPSDPPLSPQQSLVCERITNGENFFFTGSAGTGKSVLLRAIIKAFKRRAAKAQAEAARRIQESINEGGGAFVSESGDSRGYVLGVTASTGMAAV